MEQYRTLINKAVDRAIQASGAIEQGEMVEAPNKPVDVPKSVKDAPQVECNQAERTNIQGFGLDDIPFAVQTDYICLTAITYQA